VRNITSKLPERLHREVKSRYWQILEDFVTVAEAKTGLLALAGDYRASYPSSMKTIDDHVDQLSAHLRFPLAHRKRTRSTNLLERSLGEVKRRTKVMGRFPGEDSCLTLVWAVLDLLITHQTNGIHFNALDRQRLKRARYQGTEQTIPQEVTAA